jgi:hypothetical protein
VERGPYLGLPYYHSTQNEPPEFALKYALHKIVMILKNGSLKEITSIEGCCFDDKTIDAVIYELVGADFIAPMLRGADWYDPRLQEKPFDMFVRAVGAHNNEEMITKASSVCAA